MTQHPDTAATAGDLISRAVGLLAEWESTPAEGDPMIDVLLGVIDEALGLLRAIPAAPEAGEVERLPEDIAAAVLNIGKVDWGATTEKDAEDHASDLIRSIGLTHKHFGTSGPREMHGVYIAGSGTVVCHTGTSPNSPIHARTLVGAWNWLHEIALSQPAQGGEGGAV